MMEVSSYKSSATYDASLTGIPGLPADEVDVHVASMAPSRWTTLPWRLPRAWLVRTSRPVTAALAEDAHPLVDLINGWEVDGRSL